MRICHIISGDLYGGAEAVSWHLINGLKASACGEICAVLFNHGQLFHRLKKLNIEVCVIDEQRNSPQRMVVCLARHFKKLLPSVVHTHGYKENVLGLAAVRLSQIGRVALVCTQHGLPEQGHLRQRCVQKVDRWLQARYFDCIVCVSHEMKRWYVEQSGFTAQKVAVVHNGITLPGEAQTAVRSGRSHIGSAGRLYPVKDFPLMVDIAKAIMEKNSEVHFSIAGEGPEREKIWKRIKLHHLDDRFHLLGHLPEMSSFYKNLDIYLNTSLHEGIPMSVLEAMAHGVPVIAPRKGGFMEIIRSGVDGFLIDSRDPHEFAIQCLELINSAQMRSQMKLSACQRVRSEFSQEAMVGSYIEIYQRLVNRFRQH